MDDVICALDFPKIETQNKSPLPTGFSSTVSPQPLRFRPAAGLDVRQTIEEDDMTLSEAKKLSHLLARIGAHLDQSAEFVRDHDTEKNFA